VEKRPAVDQRPKVIVTGASGLLGRHLIQALGDRYYIHALARRSPRDVGIELRPNIRWTPVDLGDEASVKTVMESIAQWGGADHVIHLAGYYDFTDENHPEYQRTNIQGTANVFKYLPLVRPRHLIYSSSLVVHDFNSGRPLIDEDAVPDAVFPYALSKIRGEEMARQQAQMCRASIVRIGAIYTDWCEYEPLFNFLNTWLSDGFISRVLGGKGESALPYLHVDDFTSLIQKLMEKTEELPRCGVYIAAPDGATSHQDLHTIANRYSFGEHRSPIHMPRLLCLLGILARRAWGVVTSRKPFERPWMLRYLDRVLATDSSRTRKLLGWAPTPRLSVTRRLLFLMENMKGQPYEWRRKNEAAAHHTVPERLNFKIHERMLELREPILASVESCLMPHLGGMGGVVDKAELRRALDLLFRGLEIAIRIGDRKHILSYARQLVEGSQTGNPMPSALIKGMLENLARVTEQMLLAHPQLAGLAPRIHDLVALTFQLVGDEVEDALSQVQVTALS
jgi:nucleoside-diphosphate-sugar epimerase